MMCDKCGAMAMQGPTYNRMTDKLMYRCGRCGYTESRLPLDRQRQKDVQQDLSNLTERMQRASEAARR